MFENDRFYLLAYHINSKLNSTKIFSEIMILIIRLISEKLILHECIVYINVAIFDFLFKDINSL